MTLRELALKAGVSTSTVSRALRNDPRLREETCKRIQSLALRVGYRPNPLIAALSERRWQGDSRSDVSTIAWVSSDIEPRSKDDWFFSKILLGAKRRADTLGFKLETFEACSPGMTGERFSQILVNRGILGVCVAPLGPGQTRLEMDWERFSCATIGYSMKDPILHRASPHHAQGLAVAIEHLRSEGCRRIGISMTPDENRRVNHQWMSGALLAGKLDPDLFVTTFVEPAKSNEKFRQWIMDNRLDVVLSATNAVRFRLKAVGIDIPCATLAWLPNSDVDGIDQKFTEVGAAAIDLVIGQLRRNERGLPKHPRVIMIDGEWHSGTDSSVSKKNTLSSGKS